MLITASSDGREVPKVNCDAIKSLKLYCYSVDFRGTFGKLKVKLNIFLSSEYDLTWLDCLWLSLGEEGTFLNGCFKRYTREREKKRKKNQQRVFRDVLSRYNDNFKLEISPSKSTSLIWRTMVIWTNFPSHTSLTAEWKQAGPYSYCHMMDYMDFRTINDHDLQKQQWLSLH